MRADGVIGRAHCAAAVAVAASHVALPGSSLTLDYCLTLSLTTLVQRRLPRPAIVRLLSNVDATLAVHPPVHLPHSLLLQVAPHGTVLQLQLVSRAVTFLTFPQVCMMTA